MLLFYILITHYFLKERISEFNADEHDLIGQSSRLPKITLPNGARVDFGKIVALAGDFYGVADKPIIDPDGKAGKAEELQRFKAAFDTLGASNSGNSMEQLNKLVSMIDEDHAARESGKELHSHADWDRATGGTWVGGLPVKPGQMLNLAMNNYDHFQPQAEKAYLVGHKLAIAKAREAGLEKDRTNQEKKLMEAYSIDAFACHFLTDSFSGGHIRFE